MITANIEALITYLNQHPEMLYEALNNRDYRWEIIDLFINDINRPEHWYTLQEYNKGLLNFNKLREINFRAYLCTIYGLQLLGEYALRTIYGNKIKKKEYIIKKDGIDEIGKINLWITDISPIANMISILTTIYTITSEYMLEEIIKGNISPELVKLLTTIFQI